MNTPRPNPFLMMLYSRKVWIAIVGLLALVLSEYTTLSVAVQGGIVAVMIALIGSIAWEDAAEKSAPTTINAGTVDSVNTTNNESVPL